MRLKLSFIAILISSIIFISGSPEMHIIGNSENVELINYPIGNVTITIDGSMDEWSSIEKVPITLKPARPVNEANASYSVDFYSTHDASKIYFLVVVKNDPYYFYNYDNGINHRYAPALALAFPIDEGAKVQFMGGTDRDTIENIETATGMVDIMHWELDTLAGVVTGGTKNTTAGSNFGDGVANLDDEWAITPEDRHDDNDQPTSENSYLGSWSHTSGGDANGSAGDWIFEISRKLNTGDIYDAQFVEGELIDVAIAFWTPNEHTDKRWSDDGHYVNWDNVIQMNMTAFPEQISTTQQTSTFGSNSPSSISDDPTLDSQLFIFTPISLTVILLIRRKIK